MILAIDPSSAKTGLCLGALRKKKIHVLGFLRHATQKQNKDFFDRAYLNIKQLEEWLDENVDFNKVYAIAIEASPIPGYSGRILTIYLGMFLNTILLRRQKGTIIKLIKPLDWQRPAFGNMVLAQSKKERDIKKLSKELVKRKYQLDIKYDDVTDAILIYDNYHSLPFFNIKQEYQPWGKKRD